MPRDPSLALLRARTRRQRRRRALHRNLQTFDTSEDLRATRVVFATHYNKAWLVARHGYRTQPKCEPINASLIRTQWPI